MTVLKTLRYTLIVGALLVAGCRSNENGGSGINNRGGIVTVAPTMITPTATPVGPTTGY